MKKLLCVLFFLLCLVPVQAQDSEWEVVIYVPKEFIVLSNRGIEERISIPEEVSVGFDDYREPFLRLSYDRRWLAFQSDYGSVIQVADLGEGTCCLELTPDTLQIRGEKFSYVSIIDFNPTKNELLIFYADDEKERLGLIDIEQLEFKPLDGLSKWSWQSWYLKWTMRGVIAYGNRDFCSFPCLATNYFVDAYTGEVISQNPAVFSEFDMGDYLEATGEYIAPYRLPHPEEEELMVMGIIYLSDENTEAVPVYFEGFTFTDDYSNYMAKWVMDGQAVLARFNEWYSYVLIERNGKFHSFDVPAWHTFLAGTPDGWLMVDRNERLELTDVYFYTFDGNEVISRKIASDPSLVTALWDIVDSPVLGESVKEPFYEDVEFPLLPLG